MAYVTDAYTYLKNELLALAPGSKWGGDFADKPGYHNCRSNLPSNDYSVVDKPPDGGGSSTVAAAIDWTFPDAQAGNYATISKFTKRLLASAKDVNDPRLNGYREFYGNAGGDSYVDGWDCRYGVPATSDSSHLWHIHISEDRDKTGSFENKDMLLSVLRGESVEEWGDDVSAKDVWSYDIDPTPTTYSAGGSMWTMLNRTGYLANSAMPQVLALLNDISSRLTDLENAMYGVAGGDGGEEAS
jgi:hypothetical protein